MHIKFNKNNSESLHIFYVHICAIYLYASNISRFLKLFDKALFLNAIDEI